MSKNKAENAIIKFLILSHLSTKALRCKKVQKLKHSFPDAMRANQIIVLRKLKGTCIYLYIHQPDHKAAGQMTSWQGSR